MARRTLVSLLGAALLVSSSCSTSSDTSADSAATVATPSPTAGDDRHGAVAGAREVPEPQLHLVTIDPSGDVGMLDLLTDTATDLGSITAPSAATTDGRYVFATVPAGVQVIDSGMWTWDHGDHFHFYRSEPHLLGTVPGEGAATVSAGPLSTAGGTGVLFESTGEAVLLDNEALSEGRILEAFRLELGPQTGLIAPFGDGAVVTVPDGSGAVTAVRLVDAAGEPVEGMRARCDQAQGTITTPVGLVVGCADGALLWTKDGDEPNVERIPYPDGADAPAATAFSAREGRPTVAALAGRTGFWLLDTRERTWQLHDVGVPLLRVSASDDEEGHVVALDQSGRVRVYAADTGEQLATTQPLLSRTLRERGGTADLELIVDQERAYLNAPAEGVVYEIDYADSARVARRLKTPTQPAFLAETGR